MALQRWWFFPCRVDCTHQAALPPVCVADDHLPCALQHAKIVFSLIEHSRVRLFKDDVASGKLDVASLLRQVGSCFRQHVTRAFLDAVVAWRWVNGHDRCLTCLGGSTLRRRSWMSHLLTVDAHLGVAARLRYPDKGAELLPPSRSSSRPGCRQARSASGGSTAGLRITVVANPQGTIAPLALRNQLSCQ